MMGALVVAAALLAQLDSTAKPYWVLNRTEAYRNEIVSGWIVIDRPTSDPVRLELPQSAEVSAWFPGPAGCRGATRDSVAASSDRVQPVCVTSRHEGGVRALALVADDSASSIVVSPVLTIKARSWPAWILPVATSIVGFILGLLTSAFQARQTRNAAKQAATLAIHGKILEHLLPELRYNRDLLQQHAKGLDQDKPPVFAGSIAIADDNSVMGFLKADERAGYLAAFNVVYQALGSYNNAMRSNDASAIRRTRQDALEKLNKLIG